MGGPGYLGRRVSVVKMASPESPVSLGCLERVGEEGSRVLRDQLGARAYQDLQDIRGSRALLESPVHLVLLG